LRRPPDERALSRAQVGFDIAFGSRQSSELRTLTRVWNIDEPKQGFGRLMSSLPPLRDAI